jgi:MFS transporter, NNP family, nitrate/nitrite transporter
MSCFSINAQAGWKKYDEYFVEVDPDQDDKAKEIKLCSFARPHMRAFHLNWWGFFTAFFIWFAIAPLLSEIRTTLNLTKQQIWTSSIFGVGGTIFMRFVNGPLCDKFGPRLPFMSMLCFASIPCGLVGLINSAVSLSVIRLLIGFGGSTFVMCQFWSSRMFAREVVGTANALCAGWGNLGGGVTQLVMGTMLFPLFKLFFASYPNPSEMAWRTVCVVPAVIGFVTGICVYVFADDAPKGNYKELKMRGAMPEISAAASFRSGAMNINTWLLFL